MRAFVSFIPTSLLFVPLSPSVQSVPHECHTQAKTPFRPIPPGFTASPGVQGRKEAERDGLTRSVDPGSRDVGQQKGFLSIDHGGPSWGSRLHRLWQATNREPPGRE